MGLTHFCEDLSFPEDFTAVTFVLVASLFIVIITTTVFDTCTLY